MHTFSAETATTLCLLIHSYIALFPKQFNHQGGGTQTHTLLTHTSCIPVQFGILIFFFSSLLLFNLVFPNLILVRAFYILDQVIQQSIRSHLT